MASRIDPSQSVEGLPAAKLSLWPKDHGPNGLSWRGAKRARPTGKVS
jgi:hypothetical protein